MQWVYGGFFAAQLWQNYFAFVPVLSVRLSLYFVSFTHTTLLALALHTPNDADLWNPSVRSIPSMAC